MEPLAVFGALASAVQLLDVSVKVSRSACGFVSSLKHVKEDVRHLQTKALQEAESLMRDLQFYASEAQRCPPESVRNHMISDSIAQIARQFSEDMDALRGILPAQMPSPFPARMAFVLNRKLDGIRLQSNILSAADGIKALSVSQDALSQTLSRRCDALEAQLQGQKAEVLEGLQYQLSKTSLDFASLETRVHSQQQSLDDLSSLMSSAVASPDVLGRMVRAELRQQLEPLLRRFADVSLSIDQIALGVSKEASERSDFKTGRSGAIHGLSNPGSERNATSNHSFHEIERSETIIVLSQG
ncbi:hypothetical protein DL766_003563 [Monosporascus sp. MC13-8B]|uniref:Fungal N-terminal domain-containing protein n=1 Tax=Monosporascus cannonballus TaxID=155416 RepID=A0ABY0HCX9_9PEZI|nr:hypothetical protein DL763_006798 [Monosporascus cannonballus]RYO87570.1 hypothetical protein DL762_004216 [Monosporascus cannonballus]RYP33258.1 hypothetical protein DL766_003563 [Monosporascus sp. MC13-8B]